MRSKALIRSFFYAFKGLLFSFRTQQNFRIHLFIAVLVCLAGGYFELTNSEWIAVLLCFGMVFGAELFNTAIEQLADKLHPEHDAKIGLVKDLAAAAVLIAALVAIVVGLLVFIPKF